MDNQKVKEIMSERGFTYNMESRNGSGETIGMYFMSETEFHRHHLDVVVTPPFNCTVFPKSGEFQFTYAVPCSINELKSPKCSPFDNEDHFNRICVRFEAAVKVLHRAFDAGELNIVPAPQETPKLVWPGENGGDKTDGN